MIFPTKSGCACEELTPAEMEGGFGEGGELLGIRILIDNHKMGVLRCLDVDRSAGNASVE